MAMGLADDDSKVFRLDESWLNVDDDSMRDDAVRAADAGGDEVKFVDADADALLFDDMKPGDNDFGDNVDNSNNVTNAQSIDMDESAHELLDDSRVPLTPIRKPASRGSALPSPSAVSTTTTPSTVPPLRPRVAAAAEKLNVGGSGQFAAYLGVPPPAGGNATSSSTSAKQTPASVLRRRTPSTSRVPHAPVMHYSSVAVDRNEQNRLESAEQMQLNLAKVYFDLKVLPFAVSIVPV